VKAWDRGGGGGGRGDILCNDRDKIWLVSRTSNWFNW